MRRNRCFIDTSALIALNDAKDQYNKESRDIAATLEDSELIITDAVITETYNILRYRLGFHIAHFFLKTVLAGHPFVIAEVTPQIRTTTLQILEQYNNHKISYCDALSVAMMKDHKIEKVFAFDYHFEIMGVQLVQL